MFKKYRLPLVALALAVTTLFAANFIVRSAAAAGVDTTRDCDNTAIIHCGVMTLDELKTKYAANEAGDLPAIYKAFNVDTSFTGLVDGVVYRDGTVVVGGKTIATGAQTAARNLPGGAIAGSSAKVISPSVWPAEFITGKPAFVRIVNGTFTYAILKTCGNPIKAKPVTPPPTPVATCVSVEPIKKTRDTYDFKGTATATGGATIQSYVFTITHSSGTAKIITVTTNATSATSGPIQLETGKHTVKLVVKTSVGDKTSAACTAPVTILEEGMVTVCNPATGEEISVKQSEASKYKPVGDAACKPVKVCDAVNRVIIEVPKAKAAQYESVDSDKCQNAKVCDTSKMQIITVPKDQAGNYSPEEACHVKGETTTPPVTPPAEVPSTGPTDFLIGGAGLSSLTAAGYYWRASRRKLLSTMLNR